MTGYTLLHGYTGPGVESEALSAVGRTVRVGLEPGATAPGEPVTGDMTQPPVDPEEIDLALLQPPCARWSTLTSSSGDRSDHPNYIPDARAFGRRCGDYVIENVPAAPLNDPVELEGRMFNLPVKLKRAFETSFPVSPPPLQHTLPTAPDGWDSDGLAIPGRWTSSAEVWRAVKGYTRDYPPSEFKRSAIPRPYIDYLLRAWLCTQELSDGG